MSPGISLTLHWWRGFGPDLQGDLFWVRLRLGIATLSVECRDPFPAYRGMRQAAEDALAQLNRRVRREEEGR